MFARKEKKFRRFHEADDSTATNFDQIFETYSFVCEGKEGAVIWRRRRKRSLPCAALPRNI